MNKRGLEFEELGKIILAVVLFLLMVGLVVLLFKGKAIAGLTRIKDLLRFGR